jgi:hypothetical protein
MTIDNNSISILSIAIVAGSVLLAVVLIKIFSAHFIDEQSRSQSQLEELMRFSREKNLDIPELVLLKYYLEHAANDTAWNNRNTSPLELEQSLASFFNRHEKNVDELHLLEKLLHSEKGNVPKTAKDIQIDEPVIIQDSHSQLHLGITIQSGSFLKAYFPGDASKLQPGEVCTLVVYRNNRGEYTMPGSVKQQSGNICTIKPSSTFKKTRNEQGRRQSLAVTLTLDKDDNSLLAPAAISGSCVWSSNEEFYLELQMEEAAQVNGRPYQLELNESSKPVQYTGRLYNVPSLPSIYRFTVDSLSS